MGTYPWARGLLLMPPTQLYVPRVELAAILLGNLDAAYTHTPQSKPGMETVVIRRVSSAYSNPHHYLIQTLQKSCSPTCESRSVRNPALRCNCSFDMLDARTVRPQVDASGVLQTRSYEFLIQRHHF